MRRRISLAALALGGVSAVLIVGIAPAVGKPGTPPHVMQLTCKFTLTTEPPPGSDAVVPPQQSGNQDGGLDCSSNPSFGKGAIRTYFTVPASGDTQGTFVQYLDTGALSGRYRLIPKGGSFGGSTYQAQNYGGQFKVTQGTGAFTGIRSSSKGTGYCTSPDSVHLSCTENLWLYDPQASSSS